MANTREDMERIILSGQSVLYKGKVLSSIVDLPTQEEIDKESASMDIKAMSVDAVNRIISFLRSDTPSPLAPTKDVTNDLAHAETDPARGLGRVVAIDFRDAKFPFKAKLEEAKASDSATLRYKHYSTAKALDQGNTSQCVAYTGEQLLLSAPVKNLMFKTPADLYHECQLVDEWPGEDYDGTSVRALFKVLREKNYISEYSWGESLEDVINYLFNIGPVAFGTNWYNSQFYPDAKTGFVSVKGASGIAGGHAYLAKGVNLGKKCPDGSLGAIRFINSWGLGWGDKGMFWMSFADCARLISENGEVAAGKELKLPVEAKG